MIMQLFLDLGYVGYFSSYKRNHLGIFHKTLVEQDHHHDHNHHHHRAMSESIQS